VTALAFTVYVDGVKYDAGTDHTAMPTAVVDEIRNPNAWVGGVAPAVTTVQVGKKFITMADLSSATRARASLGIEVDTSKGHLVPTGTAPTAAAQAGAGTSASAAVAGRDTAGVVTLTSGSASLAAGAQVILTFNKPFAVAPAVVVSGGSAAAEALQPYATASTTTLTIGFGSAPSASTAYPVHYIAIGK
jgi:hypothetical protein